MDDYPTPTYLRNHESVVAAFGYWPHLVTLKHHLVHFAFSDIVKTDLEQNKANKAIM